MKLLLKWESKEKRQYSLGVLEKRDDKYVFEIDEQELKNAIKDGCVGIGNFNFLEKKIVSDKLFTFFKNRIPTENNWKIGRILKKYNLKEYDKMELLKLTKGKSINDRYWVEEIKEKLY